MAQVALPYGITPINGEIRLLYRPGFESKCSASGEGVDTPLTSATTVAVNSVGSLSYRLKMDGVTAIFDINEDGFGLIEKLPMFEAENSTLVDTQIADSILALIKTSPPGYGIIGKTLRQRSSIDIPNIPNACAAIPEATQKLNVIERRAIGTANINGRSSLIVKSEIEFACIEKDTIKVSINANGWESFDVQSGLQGNSITKMTFKFDNAVTASLMKIQCTVSQSLVNFKINTEASRAVEHRLFEIKSLMEKGLITEEQFNQKRIDIMKLL